MESCAAANENDQLMSAAHGGKHMALYEVLSLTYSMYGCACFGIFILYVTSRFISSHTIFAFVIQISDVTTQINLDS